MSFERPDRVVKVLSRNDVGDTRSHQAGWTVPKGVAWFFPPLDPARLNPDHWLVIVGPGGQFWSWRYIYYNNRLHHLGTRDEYRLTHVLSAMRDLGAAAGDVVEFTRQANDEIHLRLLAELRPPSESGRHIIDLSGPSRWFIGDFPVR